MDDIKRYTPYAICSESGIEMEGKMEEDPKGEYVNYIDYQYLEDMTHAQKTLIQLLHEQVEDLKRLHEFRHGR